MEINDILDSKANYKKLSPVQKANFEYSLCWKKTSFELLINANNEEEFASGVAWCGKTGNVSRTVPNNNFKPFAIHLYKNKKQILDGTFHIEQFELDNAKKPLSWISKISHILSPKMYPLIYDSYVRKELGIKSIEDFNKLLLNLRKNVVSKTDNDIYRIDSAIWAHQTERR